MRVERAPEDPPPRPAKTASFGWIGRVKARVSKAVRSRAALLQVGPDDEANPELADLWLMLLASDPEGTWRPWPGAIRRHQLDDTEGT